MDPLAVDDYQPPFKMDYDAASDIDVKPDVYYENDNDDDIDIKPDINELLMVSHEEPIGYVGGGSGNLQCPDCGRLYKLKSSLFNHRKYECGKEPQFKCPKCGYMAKQKGNFKEHMFRKHRKSYYQYREQFGI